MKAEVAVLDIQGQYRVYTEHYRSDEAEQTIILVNGSLSTTASFAQTLRYLYPQFNVVLFDLPYAGQSRAHNSHTRLISREQEADILLELIEHFACDLMLSFSWGGIATLQALARQPRRIRKAVINSFSPVTNAAMHDYLVQGLQVLRAGERNNIAALLNDTIGKHLPSLFKRFNHRHVAALHDDEYRQMGFHVETVLNMDGRSCASFAGAIDIPLLFVNGEWDEYTSAADARQFAQHVRHCSFACVPQAGHFLDMEHKAAWLQTRNSVLSFLTPNHSSAAQRFSQPYAQALAG